MRGMLLRGMIPLFLAEELTATASELVSQSVTGAGLDLLGSILQKVMLSRYPSYSTLICAPHWQERVTDYVRALKSNDIPLACKRGREKWKADGDTAAKVFGTTRMNLTGGAFMGLENLLAIASVSRTAPLEIEFRIHPFEQRIIDLITEQRTGADRKFKVDGKDCWWIATRDLLPIMAASGYSVPEMNRLVEIGESRGSFGKATRDGEQILYRKPIDIEEMRRQLHEKLDDFQDEWETFRTLPDFHSTFDPEALSREIDQIQDEADYDRIQSRINKEFEALHARLPGYFDKVAEKFKAVRNDCRALSTQVDSARGASYLKALPAGKSRWCADLGRCIVGNLKSVGDDLRKAASDMTSRVEKHIAQFVYLGPGAPKENIALILKANATALDEEAAVKTLKQNYEEWTRHLRDFEEWLNLLKKSDQVYEDLLQLRAEEQHKVKAAQLLEAHDRVSQQISEHLTTRNVQGLPAHKQFAARFDEIDKERVRYLGQLKGEFDKNKETINQLLDSLKIGRRVTVVFNPGDIQGCYDQMYEQGAQLIREAAQGYRDELQAQERELVYARDILGALSEDIAEPLINRLANARSDITTVTETVTREWLAVTISGTAQGQTLDLSRALTEGPEVIHAAQQAIRISTKSTPPTEGRSKFVYDLVPDKESVNLKDVIIKVMAQSGDPKKALDESLESIVDLFKRNCVQINIERPRTRIP